MPGTAYGCVTKVSQLRRGQLRRDRHVCIVDVVPREPRDTAAGFFHLYAHCVWATDRYFRDDVDRMVFLRELARATMKFEWTCVAYCLMRSHYHLIVGVDAGVLPRAMQSLNWRYAMDFNVRHALRGVTQFKRYGSRRLADDDDLVNCFRYVVRNPVDAALCERPEDWAWSSYAATIGLRERASFVDDRIVLDYFGGAIDVSQAALRRFVDRADADPWPVPGTGRGPFRRGVANGREMSYVLD